MFEKGTPKNTKSALPTTEYIMVVDPECFCEFENGFLATASTMILELRNPYLAKPVIEISLLLPKFLYKCKIDVKSGNDLFYEVGSEPSGVEDVFKKKMPEKLLSKFRDIEIKLLNFDSELQSEGLITNNKMLVQERYEIYRYTNIRIIPVNELDDFLGIIAHGNLMFWGKGIPRGMESFEILYCKDILYDNKEIMVVYNDIRTKVKDNPKVEDCLKSVLLNRLPMILYARDMVKFYEIQLDHFKRRGLIGRFSMLLNYHLTYFYLLAWGMLDHLTLLINLVKDYKFKDRDCGIRIKQYLEVLEKDMPKTSALINKESKWIDVIADMRHHAAHKTIALVNDIYQETDESQKTDEEVMEFLKREEPYFFQYLPKELVDKMLPEKIFNWKFRHLKVILPNAAMIKLNDKDCMIFPTIDIDFNVIKVKEILALVLSELFP